MCSVLCSVGCNEELASSVQCAVLSVHCTQCILCSGQCAVQPCRVVSYLLPSSCHPSFITKNIPYSLAFRLVRIESTAEGLEKNLLKLQEELISRGYRPAIVAAAVERAEGLSRAATLVKVPRPANQRPVLSLPLVAD